MLNLKRIFAKKQQQRKVLADQNVAEKLAALDALRDRTVSIQNATRISNKTDSRLPAQSR